MNASKNEKISGNVEFDIDRLIRIGEILNGEAGHSIRFTLDGNEQFQTIAEFRDDELAHRDTGLAHGATGAPAHDALTAAIKAGSRVAIWLSERF